jgi:hypothetical protein
MNEQPILIEIPGRGASPNDGTSHLAPSAHPARRPAPPLLSVLARISLAIAAREADGDGLSWNQERMARRPAAAESRQGTPSVARLTFARGAGDGS